ncbi:GAP family protein [Conyzicola sp.]|uniref:GAP family protein n=1 Tax=Conyzicola sp. TaxID=1969404 RepID=UPI00398941B6
MTLALAGILVVLALIDSTSIGTLVIPLWLLATPGRLRPDRVLLFLATVVLFYFAVGLAILWGAGWAFESIAAAVDSPIGAILLLVAGAALVVWSFVLERQAKRQKAEGVAVPGRVRRWRERAVGGDGGAGALIALALTATTIELGSMLPYLGAIGSITASGIEWPLSAAVLAGYCLVMVLPAIGLLVARVVAAGRIEPVLSRLESWLTRSAGATLSWVVGILGVLLVLRAFDGGVADLLP